MPKRQKPVLSTPSAYVDWLLSGLVTVAGLGRAERDYAARSLRALADVLVSQGANSTLGADDQSRVQGIVNSAMGDVQDIQSHLDLIARLQEFLAAALRANDEADPVEATPFKAALSTVRANVPQAGSDVRMFASMRAANGISEAFRCAVDLGQLPAHDCKCVAQFVSACESARSDLKVIRYGEDESSYALITGRTIAFTIGRSHVGDGQDLFIEIPESDDADLQRIVSTQWLFALEAAVAGASPDDDAFQVGEGVFHIVPSDRENALARLKEEFGDLVDKLPDDIAFATPVVCEVGTVAVQQSHFAEAVQRREQEHACGNETRH